MLTDPREIQAMEKYCVEQHPPFCTAACPVHVDVRAMVAAIRRGDWAAAYNTLQKAVLFPGIIGRICDHPCEAKCKRQEAGEKIRISALEKACVQYAGLEKEKSGSGPLAAGHGLFGSKKQRIAVVGGGLSGMATALTLARKGYPVVLFEALSRPGGRLREIPEQQLPRTFIDREAARLTKAGVELQFNVRIKGKEGLAKLREEFAAVCLAVGQSKDDFGLKRDGEGRLKIAPLSFATSEDGVFAGGSLGRAAASYSPISSVSDGRRMTNSVERYLQGASLTANRQHEGPVETLLYTDTSGLEPLPAVQALEPEKGYSREEARSEAKRCLQCHCLVCVEACPYLRHFQEYPGSCLRTIAKNLIILPGMGLRSATRLINSCSLCGLCGEVCPQSLNMADVNRAARRMMQEKGYMPPAIHDFSLRDMLFSSSEKCLLLRHQPGLETSRYLFFPGCQLTASAPESVGEVYAYLRSKLAGGVGLMFNCCGAPAKWAGKEELFQEQLQSILSAWESHGKPRIILACPTCYAVFKDNLPEIPVYFLAGLLLKIGLPARASRGRGRQLAVHDACTARLRPNLQNSVREILHQLEYRVVELPYGREKTKCCGFGGLLSTVNPALAAEAIQERSGESPADFLVYCANCRDLFVQAGKRAYHFLDFLWGTPDEAPRPAPDFSQRRENRLSLKNKLLREVWGEKVAGYDDYTNLQLVIPTAVREKMNREFILVEDVQQVIHFAEKSGNRLVDPASRHFIAHYRPAIITYWVEYSAESGQYHLHNVYSHRMQIVEDAGKGELENGT